MNEQAASLAALNVSLLEAIKAGPAESAPRLAERAGIVPNNVNRKLDSLLAAGLIAKTGPAAHEVELTDAGARGLVAMSVWRGDFEPAASAPAADGISYLPFARIDAWALNPRTQFDPAAIRDMAQSIAEFGVLQPITVRSTGDDRFEVVIGERRRRGAALAVAEGLIEDPDFLIPCQIRNWTDDEALDVAGVENLQRHDLHWMDEAKFYLRLAERGRSGAEIARLAGESVSKRKVQDYCKIARELEPADVARTYLPETDKNRLLYAHARDLVGEKKEKPALDLSPKLAVTFLEIIAAGLAQEGKGAGPLPATGHVVETTFAKPPPSGGPLSTLQHDRHLISFGFKGRDVVARTKLTEDVFRWLAQLGFATDRDMTLRKARAAVVGDMQAAALHRDGHWFVAELNAPTPTERPDPMPPSTILATPSFDAAPVPPPSGEGDREAVEGVLPEVRGNLAIPVLDGKLQLSPSQRRKLVEIAHKIVRKDADPMFGAPIQVHPNAHLDDDFIALELADLLTVNRHPDGFTTYVSFAGEAYLEQHDLIPDGEPTCRALDKVYRADSRGEAAFILKTLHGRYSTDWMNPEPYGAMPGEVADDAVPPPSGEGDREAVEGVLHDDLSGPPPALRDTSPDGEELAAWERRLIGPAAQVSRPELQPPALAATEFPPILATIVIEVGAAIAAAGVKSNLGRWGAVALSGFHRDSHLGALIQKHGLLQTQPAGDRTLVCLTAKGAEWLEETQDIAFRDGKPEASSLHLRAAQLRLMGSHPLGRHYFTDWLNPPQAAPPEPEAAEAEPAGADAAHPSRGRKEADREAAYAAPAGDAPTFESELTEPTKRLAAQSALVALHGAARQAIKYLDSLPGKTKAPKRDEVGPFIEMLGRALDLAAKHLPGEQG